MAEIILTIVVEVVKCVAPSAYREISHLREKKYTSNLQNLKTQVAELEGKIVSTQHAVVEAKRKGEEIEQGVQIWLARANNDIVGAKKFVGDEATENRRCFKGLCPNLKTRRRLSKEAVRLKEAIVEVLEARTFDSISYRIMPEDTWLMSKNDYEAFESRMSILNEIIDALKNPNVNMLGIYGMGGIGKTTLAKEVARKAKNDKLFDQVVFSEVSESQVIRKIQGEIADKLGLPFREESDSGRARSLCNRMKKEKILVILDNIWESLDLQAVGIPHGDDHHKGCKVLLTARSLDTLSRKMDSQKNFSVGVLKDDEAWSLFKKMAGDYIEGSELEEVAREVAKKCGDLPVSIVTVARALRNNKSLFDWQDALKQLRTPSSENFEHIQPEAYKAIKLSYDKLGREELKHIFLLIGYAAIASIDDLLIYGMALGLFQGVNKIEAARARVHSSVHKLKASCMLLDHISENEALFSMHDVVRDVAISIASAEKNVFTATGALFDGCREWSDESAVKRYTSIVLHDIKTNLLPEAMECPQLKLLFISADKESSSLTVPNKFFESMEQVRVINLTNMNLLPLPSSFGLLSNLRTLSLYKCNLLDITVIRELKKLEILRLQHSNIKKLPVEVGELTLLRLLDLRYCWGLEVFPPNVLSNLTQLEELYIGDGSFHYGLDYRQMEVMGDELKHLLNLTSLELQIQDVNTLPRGLFFEKLERYKIHIGHPNTWDYRITWCRQFSLNLDSKIRLKDGLIVQLQRIENLGLFGLQEQDVNYFANELAKVGSSQLKGLCIEGSPNPTESKRREESANDLQSHEIILEDNVNISNTLFIEKVALPKLEKLQLFSINVERIWQNQVVAMSCGFQNLTYLSLYKCINLRCLFSSSIVSSFRQLQGIVIKHCRVLEELIVIDNQEERKNNIVMFPQLQYIHMYNLEKLTSFCKGDVDILEFPSLKELYISQCPEFMASYISTNNVLTEKVFSNLEELTVEASYIVTNKSVFSEELLCKLKYLKVARCHHLVNLVPSSTSFQNLTTLEVSDCEGLKNVLPSSIATTLVRLREMKIKSCVMITEIVLTEAAKDKDITFSELKELKLSHMESLTSFYSGNCTFRFPTLERLLVEDCPNMKFFSGGELSTPKLHKVQLKKSDEACWVWKDDLNTTIQQVGKAEKNMGTTFGDVNQYAQLVEEAEGLEKIENLESHDNNEISEKAVEILETYWLEADDDSE